MRLRIGVSPEMVKEEAERRILLIMPVHKQMNALALAERLRQQTGSADPSDWPAEFQPLVAQANAAFDAINVLRAASDRLEAMRPIPPDYQSDQHWS